MDDDPPPVTDGRALLTDRDRKQLAHGPDVSDQEHYQAVSRVRRRVRENLGEDIAILVENHDGLLEEVRDVVCQE